MAVNFEDLLMVLKRKYSNLAEEKQEIELEILGTGSVTGKNGKIYDDNLEELTTAKEIIKNIFVVF